MAMKGNNGSTVPVKMEVEVTRVPGGNMKPRPGTKGK